MESSEAATKVLCVTFVTSGHCAGVAYRIDQPDVLAWILANARGDVEVVALP